MNNISDLKTKVASKMRYLKQDAHVKWERFRNNFYQSCIDRWLSPYGNFELSSYWSYSNRPIKELPYAKDSVLSNYKEKAIILDKKSEARYQERKAFLIEKSIILGRVISDKGTKLVRGSIYCVTRDWFMIEWTPDDGDLYYSPDWKQTIFWNLNQAKYAHNTHKYRYPMQHRDIFGYDDRIDSDTYEYVATGPNSSRIEFNIEKP